jgi:hypothetical protein
MEQADGRERGLLWDNTTLTGGAKHADRFALSVSTKIYTLKGLGFRNRSSRRQAVRMYWYCHEQFEHMDPNGQHLR